MSQKSNAKKIQTVINSKNTKVIWLQIDRHLRLMILWYLSKIRKITSTFLTSSSDATLLGLKRRLYYSSKNTSEILKLQKCWSDLAQNRQVSASNDTKAKSKILKHSVKSFSSYRVTTKLLLGLKRRLYYSSKNTSGILKNGHNSKNPEAIWLKIDRCLRLMILKLNPKY